MVNGQIRLTEQGEIISSKFSNPEIGRRNLELLVAATLEAGLMPNNEDREQVARLAGYERVMAELSQRAYKAYRNLVYETPGFTDYFFAATPIAEIAELNLGSRPASRKSTRRIEDLRAIPWGFSWGQCRLLLPGWFGFGAAVSGWLADGNREERLALLQEMFQQWPFFATLLSNMDMVLAKTDLPIARRYAELVPDVSNYANASSSASRPSTARRCAAWKRSPAKRNVSRPIPRWLVRYGIALPTSIH
jgi:phosphoenolpyruvate carboxylase